MSTPFVATRRCCTVVVLLVVGGNGVVPAQEFQTVREARAAAAQRLRAKDEAGARAALEAALRLSTADGDRVDVYGALVTLYRKLPDEGKMIEACKFIAEHADSSGRRHGAAGTLVDFLFQRGKLDEAVAECEATLATEPGNYVALAILSRSLARRGSDQKARAEEMMGRLAELDRGRAADLATGHEATAQADPATAAWYWKDAARAWVEARQFDRALAAAEKSLASDPEQRTTLLTYYWRDGLGDVYVAASKPALAIPQYEAAITVSPIELQKEATRKKLTLLRDPAKGTPR
jgi:tetratricopeptide (TPR) repeat protein